MSENSNSGGQQKPTLSWSQPANTKPAQDAAKPHTPATPVKTAPVSSATNDSSSNLGTYAGIFVAGLIIGALIGWGITSSKSSNAAPSTTASSTDITDTAGATANKGSSNAAGSANTTSTGTLTLASTEQAGFAVAVDQVSVSQPTWLVVYEDHNGTPGNAIGAGLFFPGQNSGTIQLLRATLPGQSYFVGQSLDDGDRIFSLQIDKPVRDAQGNPLFTEFTAK